MRSSVAVATMMLEEGVRLQGKAKILLPLGPSAAVSRLTKKNGDWQVDYEGKLGLHKLQNT